MSIPNDLTDGIVLKKDGLYRYYWNKGVQVSKLSSLLDWLREPIYLDSDIIFEDFFYYIMKEYKEFSKVFSSHLGGFSLKDWLKEWNNPDPGDINENQKIGYVEFCWIADCQKDDFELWIEEYVDFHGVGSSRDEDAYGDKEWHDTNFSFGLTPLNEYKHYFLKINNDWKLLNWDSINTQKPKDNWYIVKGKKQMTVYDVVCSILYEMSWYGTPKMRQKTFGELNEQVKNLKQDLKGRTGQSNL